MATPKKFTLPKKVTDSIRDHLLSNTDAMVEGFLEDESTDLELEVKDAIQECVYDTVRKITKDKVFKAKVEKEIRTYMELNLKSVIKDTKFDLQFGTDW